MPILEPDLTDAIEGNLRGAANNLGVAAPGTVRSYNAARNTCTVAIGTHKLVESEDDEDIDEVEEYSPLQEVPVCWLVGRGIKVKGTLNPGDTVLLVCLDRDSSPWRRSGEPSEPSDPRIHDWAHAVAIPGLVPDVSPFPEPSDAATLASKLDLFLRTLSGMVNAADPASAVTAINAVLAAARVVVGGSPGVPGTGTTGSVILKLGS